MDQIKERIDTALEFLDFCSQGIDEGKIAKLEEFEKEILKICANIQERPKDDAAVYLDSLQILIEKLNILERKMEKQKGEIRNELGGLNAGQKAATAYIKAPKSESE